MSENSDTRSPPRVIVIADIHSNARALVERILKPADIYAWVAGDEAPPPDVLVLDVTQLRGDPLASLREIRATGEEAPAIVLAAHFPQAKLRDMFHLGVCDFLLKPYRPDSLCEAILMVSESRSSKVNTQILASRLERTRDQLERRSEEIRLLSEIGRVVVNLRDLNAILRRVVEAAVFVTDAEEASIYLADPKTNELILRASKHASDRHATLQRLRVEDTIVGEVFNSGQPVLRQPSLEGGPVEVQTDFLVQSLVKVPLRVRNDIVGVLGIYNRLVPRSFSEHHLTLLTALAHWTGVALEHAKLIRQTGQLKPPSEPITAVSPDLMEGLDQAIEFLNPILDASASQVSGSQYEKLAALQKHLQTLRALPVATLDAGEAEEMIDLPLLLHQVTDDLQRTATRIGLELISESEPTMPLFRGDRHRTRLIIETLVKAALRRTASGRIVLEGQRLEIRMGKSDGIPVPQHVQLANGLWAIIRVSDTSPGLSPDTVRALSQPHPDPSAGQIGPGLSMGEIRMMLESMGGVMWYEHTPASTSIIFALPIT